MSWLINCVVWAVISCVVFHYLSKWLNRHDK